jgi:hypothetical protein
MFMRYLGCGIGHKVTEHIRQTTTQRATETEADIQEDLAVDDAENLEAEPYLDEYDADEDGDDGKGNEDVENVDTDEEADFGYGDSENSEEAESEDEDDSDGEDDCVYER